MKIWYKLLLWCGLFLGMSGLFYLYGGAPAQAACDRATPLTVLTERGVVQTTMADYLPYALAAEMPVSFGAEALKAQAVAIRSYALAGGRHENADLCTLGCCVAWKDESALRDFWGADFETNMAAVRAAVSATDGEYLSYGGQAIQAAFHASSAGCTEDSAAVWSALPYLVSVESPETAEAVPGLVTTLTVSAGELAQKLSLSPTGDPAGWVQDTALDSAGRVRTVTILGRRFSGAELRRLFALRSTDFTLAWDGEQFVFTVSGYGHGVGMSQYGARLYAQQGMDYRQILAHYYPGTELVRLTPASSGPA